MSDVTRILEAAQQGDPNAADQLLPLFYEELRWDGRAHFFGAAAEAMRRILIERARRKHAARHGGGQQRVDIQEMDLASPSDDDQLLAVNDALDKLATEHKVEAELVKLRYFVGVTNEEAAEVLGISLRTAKYYWTSMSEMISGLPVFQHLPAVEAAISMMIRITALSPRCGRSSNSSPSS